MDRLKQKYLNGLITSHVRIFSWSGEIQLFGHSNNIWNQDGFFTPKNNTPSVKHSGSRIMLRNIFPASGNGSLHKVDRLQVLQPYLKAKTRC